MTALTKDSTFREVAAARAACLSGSWAKGTIAENGYCQSVVARFLDLDKKITHYTRADILALVQGWQASGLKGVTIQNKLRWLTGVFKWAVDDELIAVSPVVRSRLPKITIENPNREPFSFGEFQRVLEAVKSLTTIDCEMWRGACTVGYYTGLRISDIADLMWEPDKDRMGTWVDFAEESITAHPKKRRKVGQRLEIPIEPELYQFLETLTADRRPGRPWVLPYFHWRQETDRGDLADDFRKICDRLNLPNHSFHSFRHGFVTRLINAKVDPITVGSMTGQSVHQISRYAHVSNEAKVVALAQSRKALHAVRMEEQFRHVGKL
jgi:integrase